MKSKTSWIAFLGLTLLAVDALARAGGGENYVGSGGSINSGGGGSDGDLAAGLIYLVFAYPEVGIPVLLIVVVASIVKRAINPDRRTNIAVRRLESMVRPDISALEEIKARDERFEQSGFLKRASKVETQVQEAWHRGRMALVRHLLSDGLFRRFETQLAIMKKQGVRDAICDHKIVEARIHAVEQDTHFDTIHVEVRAEARNAAVDAGLSDEKAESAASKAPLKEFTEIWSFLRRPGATTILDDEHGDVGLKCPNCAGQLEASQTVKCGHCGALVNSGEYDWVLAEITQAEEWRPSSTGVVPGLQELVAKDPGFNRQAAEDRGSYLFWRWIEALLLGDSKPLAKCASSSLRYKIAAQIEGGPAKMFKVAVGSVDLVACETAAADGRDRFHVKVLWSCARSHNSAAAPVANVLTMGRNDGARDSGGLSYARCPNCQGPLTENDSPACDYCSADLGSGESDWVLEDVRYPDENFRLSIEPDMGNPQERIFLLMQIAAVVAADGVVTKGERKLIQTMAKRWNVPYDRFESILSGGAEQEAIAAMRPSDPKGYLNVLISAALVDGRVDAKEGKLLSEIGQKLGFSTGSVKQLIAAASGK